MSAQPAKINIQDLIRSPDPKERLRAITLLSTSGKEAGLALLQKIATEDSESEVRFHAIRAISSFKKTAAPTPQPQQEHSTPPQQPLRVIPPDAQGSTPERESREGKDKGAPTMGKGSDEKYCSECGTVIKAKAIICPACGCGQPGTSMGQAHSGAALKLNLGEGRRIPAALFALLLGCLGAHKFYLGSPVMGVIYVLFSPIAFFIGIVEGVQYLGMTDEEFTRKFGQ